MSDTNQYPNTTGFRRLLPTIANAKTIKFKPSSGFASMEEITDETGATWLYNGVNFKYWYDVEVVPLSGFTEPRELSPLTFTANTGTNAFPYPGAITGTGHINGIVVGKVESAQDEAGKVAKISFKLETTANTPTVNT